MSTAFNYASKGYNEPKFILGLCVTAYLMGWKEALKVHRDSLVNLLSKFNPAEDELYLKKLVDSKINLIASETKVE